MFVFVYVCVRLFVCLCDQDTILGFKFLKVITGSIQAQKYRTDARYLLNDYTFLYQNKPAIKTEGQLIRRNRNKILFKVPTDRIVEFLYRLHFFRHLPPVSFSETCVLGGNFLYFLHRDSQQVWFPQEPLMK